MLRDMFLFLDIISIDKTWEDTDDELISSYSLIMNKHSQLSYRLHWLLNLLPKRRGKASTDYGKGTKY